MQAQVGLFESEAIPYALVPTAKPPSRLSHSKQYLSKLSKLRHPLPRQEALGSVLSLPMIGCVSLAKHLPYLGLFHLFTSRVGL